MRYARGVFVLQNNYYSQEEVKIIFQSTYCDEGNSEKVHEYRLIDGSVRTDPKNLYIKGTVKICIGDYISRMMPVDAFYDNSGKIPEDFSEM